jgi:transcriptional regulator with XRE-family HTH domain
MARSHQLAEFLRARRERIRPEDVGIAQDDRRRVPGLRREELAMLAGLSVDYYMRLEQGRDRRPSEQVLGSLARALQLDADATTHLYGLARDTAAVAQPSPAEPDTVSPQLQCLLDTWTAVPAIVHGQYLDVLAATALAQALTPMSDPGTNILRSVFLNPEAQARLADVEHACESCVAYFRATVGGNLDNPDVKHLVRELSLESEEFRRLWARHDVQQRLSGDQVVVHPVVGLIRVHNLGFAVGGSRGQTLMIGYAAPGSQDARALERLAGLARTQTPRPRRSGST